MLAEVRMSRFEAGETNRTESDELQWGGKGINVSTVLRNLGVDNVALGFLAGFTGQALDQGLQKVGIATDFIWLPEGLTRINVKIKAGQETEINGLGPAIPAAALEELFSKLDRLQERGAWNVLVSMAGAGSLLLDETGAVHRLGVPQGKVHNSVGAGDSMVAGFLAGWLEHRDYAMAHKLGAATGSATAFSDGLATKDQVMALLNTF